MRQFHALLNRHKRHVDLDNLRFGVIAAVTANFSMGRDPKSRALRPHDFFNLPEPEPERMSGEAIFHTMKAFMQSRGAN